MQRAAEIYNAAYPYMVMTLALVSAFGAILGGVVASIQIAIRPAIDPKDGSCTCNAAGAALTFVGACGLAMACLWVGGKFSGAF